jgi:hypothetical protein
MHDAPDQALASFDLLLTGFLPDLVDDVDDEDVIGRGDPVAGSLGGPAVPART